MSDGLTYTIQFRRKGELNWSDWRFCRAAKVASWKSEPKANAYCDRLSAANLGHEFRAVAWLDCFSISR